MRQKLSSALSSHKFRSILFVLFLFGTFLFIFEIAFRLTIIKKINIQSDTTEPVKGLEPYKESNLLLLSEDQLKKNVLSQNPDLDSIEVEKKFPNILAISVLHRYPLAYLKVSGGYYELTNNAFIISRLRKTSNRYPLITYYQQFPYESSSPGSRMDIVDIQTALFFLQKTNSLQLSVASVDIQGQNMIVFKLPKGEIRFGTEKDKNKQAYELETITHQLKIEGKNYRTLDLRFDKPVIAF